MQIIIEHFLRSEKSCEYKLNVNDRMLIFILSSYMGNKNDCHPGYESICKDTGIASFSTINKSIKKLESLEILKVTRVYKKNNHYSFYPQFIESGLQICNRKLQICNQSTTDMYTNNIKNNINNKKAFFPKNEPKQTTSFWEPGNPDYDRVMN